VAKDKSKPSNDKSGKFPPMKKKDKKKGK